MIFKSIYTQSKIIIILFIFTKSAHSVIFEQTLTNFRDINKTISPDGETHEYEIDYHPLYFEYPIDKEKIGINFLYSGEHEFPPFLVYRTISEASIPISYEDSNRYYHPESDKSEKILFNLMPEDDIPFNMEYRIHLPSDIPIFRINFNNIQQPFYVSLFLEDHLQVWESRSVLVQPGQKHAVDIPTPPVTLDPRLGIYFNNAPHIFHNRLEKIWLKFIPVDPEVTGFYSCVESIQTFGGGTFNDLLRQRYNAIKYGLTSPNALGTTDALKDLSTDHDFTKFANQLFNEIYKVGTATKYLNLSPKNLEPQIDNGLLQTGTEIDNGPLQTGTEIDNGPLQTGTEIDNGPLQTGTEIDNGPLQTGTEIDNGPLQTGTEIDNGPQIKLFDPPQQLKYPNQPNEPAGPLQPEPVSYLSLAMGTILYNKRRRQKRQK